MDPYIIGGLVRASSLEYHSGPSLGGALKQRSCFLVPQGLPRQLHLAAAALSSLFRCSNKRRICLETSVSDSSPIAVNSNVRSTLLSVHSQYWVFSSIALGKSYKLTGRTFITPGPVRRQSSRHSPLSALPLGGLASHTARRRPEYRGLAHPLFLLFLTAPPRSRRRC